MTWRTCSLGEVITLQRGHDLPESQRRDGPVPIISSSGHTGFHDEAKAVAPGVVTGRYGTLGEVYYVEEDYWPLNTALYVVDFKDNHPRFVSYFLKHALANLQSDKAAVPGVNRNVLHALEVRCPNREVQERIAAALSAYDDLIENNRRRIAVLEDAARQLYQEWFVRLRFPAREHTRAVDGVPDGWRPTPLEKFLPDIRVAANPQDLEPATPYVGLEHMPRRSITLGEWGEVEQVTSTKLRFSRGDVLFGKIRPYFHKVGVALTDGVTSSDAIVLRPTEAKYHAFSALTVSSDWFVETVSKTSKEGSKMPRADWNLMSKHEVLLPPDALLTAFSAVTDPLIQQLRVLALANRQLRIARDTLLPRLMSGELTP